MHAFLLHVSKCSRCASTCLQDDEDYDGSEGNEGGAFTVADPSVLAKRECVCVVGRGENENLLTASIQNQNGKAALARRGCWC